MGQLFYRFAPLILVMSGLILWLTSFLLSEYTHIYEGLAWLPFVLLQMFISLTCGILIRRLHRGAYQDPMTGLFNRRYLYEKFTREIERIKRTKSPLSLAIIDLDEFKGINDRYGHAAGDKVLKQLAGIFQEGTRAIDTVTRLGGDEFAVILPETNNKGAVAFAERLRKTVENHNFLLHRGMAVNVTISVGIVTTEGKETDLDSFMVLADKALYKAKGQRNLVVNAGVLLSDPDVRLIEKGTTSQSPS